MSEIQEIKRKLSLLARCPTEADFNMLKQRLDMIENINGNFKRRMDDIDKRLKILQEKTLVQGNKTDDQNELSNDDVNGGNLEAIELELKAFKDEYNREIYRINKELDKKLS